MLSRKTYVYTLLLPFLMLTVASCGGGGGGGDLSPNTAASPVYNYSKIANAGAGTTFDEDSAAWMHAPDYYNYIISDSAGSPLEISIDSNFSTVVSFDTTSVFSLDSRFGLNWEVIDDANPEAANNVLDDYAAWTEINRTDVDLINLTEVGFRFESYGFFPETGSVFLGTEYVSPSIIFKDYGSSDNPYLVGSGSDSLLQLEVIASVFGDRTESGDMPASGVSDYSARGIAAGHFSRSGSFSNNSSEVKYVMGVESESILSVDHAAKTVSGNATFDYVFNKGMFAGARIEGFSLGNVVFQGTITGRFVEGTASWGDFSEGLFSGSFYGPDAEEFGGVITIRGYEEGVDGFDVMVVSVVAKK
jgi:hypothetical protein